MAKPKNKTVDACNQGDLIVDVIADVITRDIQKNPDIRLSNDDAITMRQRLLKMDKVSVLWFEQKSVEEDLRNVMRRS